MTSPESAGTVANERSRSATYPARTTATAASIEHSHHDSTSAERSFRLALAEFRAEMVHVKSDDVAVMALRRHGSSDVAGPNVVHPAAYAEGSAESTELPELGRASRAPMDPSLCSFAGCDASSTHAVGPKRLCEAHHDVAIARLTASLLEHFDDRSAPRD